MYKIIKESYPKFNDVVEQMKILAGDHWLYEQWSQNNPDGQVAIQTNDPTETNWYSGIGKSTSKTPDWEHQFCYIQPALKGTPIDEYLNWLGIKVYRTRLMSVKPKTCYSLHKDLSPRLHLPLVTNLQCNFILSEPGPAEIFHMPATGETYWVDTRRIHTFMNGHRDQCRLHLTMIVED